VRQPKLKASNYDLAELYYTQSYVTTSDLMKRFKVSHTTAASVYAYCREYARQNELELYHVPGTKLIPVNLLFEAYGWDVKDITRKVKEGAKVL